MLARGVDRTPSGGRLPYCCGTWIRTDRIIRLHRHLLIRIEEDVWGDVGLSRFLREGLG